MGFDHFGRVKEDYKRKDYADFYDKDSKDDNHERSSVPFLIIIGLFIATVVFLLIY
ncbi:MAG: hypothetical protein ACQEQA_05640 [Bacillota bacterium]